jgi:hypothetical protein
VGIKNLVAFRNAIVRFLFMVQYQDKSFVSNPGTQIEYKVIANLP